MRLGGCIGAMMREEGGGGLLPKVRARPLGQAVLLAAALGASACSEPTPERTAPSGRAMGTSRSKATPPVTTASGGTPPGAAASGAAQGLDPAASATSEDPAAAGNAGASEPAATADAGAAARAFVASAEPTAGEWSAAREVAVKGARSAGCETRLVREWLRLRCVDGASARGKPVRIDVIKGKLTGRPKGERLRAVNGEMSLIVQMLPLTDFKAQLAWEAGELEFSAERPEKGELPGAFARFDVEDDAPAATGSAAPAPSAGSKR